MPDDGSSSNDDQQFGNGSSQSQDGQQGQQQTYTAPATQEDLDRIVQNRLSKERAKYSDYDDVKAKAEAYDKAEDEKRSEVEKATNRASSAEAKIGPLEQENLRLRVALDKGLDSFLVDRLTGTTKEEMEADADALIERFAPKSDDGDTGRRRPAPDSSLGRGTSNQGSTAEQFASALDGVL